MKVSVIIPIYNVEKYLRKCIDSVINQTYHDLDIILVNDGSTDKSGSICEEYVCKDKRISVIHKENGGLSSARNVGIEKSKGDSLFFLDSDDYISKYCIEKCVFLMSKFAADISILQMMYIAEDTNEEIESFTDEKITIMNPQKAIEESLLQVNFSCCAPAKLYKKVAVENIRFPVGRLSEDLATCHLLLNNAQVIAYSNFSGYYYRQHNKSIMHIFNLRRMDALEWALDIEKFCATYYPRIVNAAYCRTFNVAVHLLLDIPNVGDIHNQFYSLIWKEVKRTRKTVLISRSVRNREKVAAVISYFGEKALKRVWKSGVAIKRKER